MSDPILVYADHTGVRSNAKALDPPWLELFSESQERAARQFGHAFCSETTHESERAWEDRWGIGLAAVEPDDA